MDESLENCVQSSELSKRYENEQRMNVEKSQGASNLVSLSDVMSSGKKSSRWTKKLYEFPGNVFKWCAYHVRRWRGSDDGMRTLKTSEEVFKSLED